MPAAGGKVYHVYPPNYKGERQEPAFTGLLAAYYTGSSHSDNFNTYPPRVQPGDTILVHAGVYKDDRFRYGGGLGTVSSGTYFLTQSGTADRPIVIKAAGDGEVVFDGDGAYNLFNVMAANYNYFEGLTIRNTDLAFQGGLKNITGSSGLTIKRSRFENVGRAIYTDWSGSKDYYIADNVMIGRFNPNYRDSHGDEVDLRELHAAHAKIGEQRLGDQAETLRSPGQRSDHRQGGDAEDHPAVIDVAADETNRGGGVGHAGAAELRLITGDASRTAVSAAMPTTRAGAGAKTIAALTNMNVNSDSRASSSRGERDRCEPGSAHHQQTSASQSARNT